MPYRVEYASTGRAGCKGPKACKDSEGNKIGKGEMRLGVQMKMKVAGGEAKDTMQWKHWGCVSSKVIDNMKKELGDDASELDGYEDMREEDQTKISKAWEEGHVADEDVTPALKEDVEAKKAKDEEKAAAKAEKEAEKQAKKEEKEKAKAEKGSATKKRKPKKAESEEEANEEEEEEKPKPKKRAKKAEAEAPAEGSRKSSRAKPAKKMAESETPEEDEEE